VIRQAAVGRGTPPTSKKAKKNSSRKQSRKKTASYKEYGDVLALKPFVSGKDPDAKINALLEHLSKRMRAIHGFDPTSDKDSEFADINDLGKFLRQVRAALKGYRFSPKKIVDALLTQIYGDKARTIIERPEKRLLCPRCRRERSYAHDSNPAFLLCLKCGKQISVEEARFKVTVTQVDSIYLNTIRRLMPALPSPPQSYTRPLVIGQVAEAA
jgi:hypothetical protein